MTSESNRIDGTPCTKVPMGLPLGDFCPHCGHVVAVHFVPQIEGGISCIICEVSASLDTTIREIVAEVLRGTVYR